MSADAVDFGGFRFDKYFWLGKLNVPWLANPTSFLVASEAKQIPEIQRAIVRFACGLPLSTRDKLAFRLFEEYQARIYNAFTGGHEVTPPLKRPADIWNLLTQPGITVPDLELLSPDCQFVATFECPWDPEHGLGILFNREGAPTQVGAPGDFR
jgi:hypothetical protein